MVELNAELKSIKSTLAYAAGLSRCLRSIICLLQTLCRYKNKSGSKMEP